jgi:GT2 family glycosyltransferase
MGVAQTMGEFILFLDDDAELGDEHVLERMLGDMTSPDIAVVGSSKILPPHSTAFQRRVALEVPRWEFPILDVSVDSNPPLDRYGFSAATTTCCLVRRSAFLVVGGFDERLTTGEDPELFYRLRKAGYRFILAARAWTFHAPPRSLRRLLVKSFEYGVGHALEARLEPSRRMELTPFDRTSAAVLLVGGPFLLLPMMCLDLQLEPARKVRLGFRPLQALARIATLYGYAWSRWTTRG